MKERLLNILLRIIGADEVELDNIGLELAEIEAVLLGKEGV